ncbi:Xanthine dehydrogenase [Nymphon striatum]|nr:Xanthine dehydrogenase [Nymphon striatum]
MAKVTFKINGNTYSVLISNVLAGPEVGPTCTLVNFIRTYAKLQGTKWMCSEGGCGVCVVHVKYQDPNTKKDISKSMNSCMIPVFACDGWDITTIERLGNSNKGYHSIQKQLTKYNGSQCGYCTPGMVMNMYGLLATDPKPTEQKVEDAFDGNICRCTGRSILQAMRSFAVDKDGNPIGKDEIPDIEHAVEKKDTLFATIPATLLLKMNMNRSTDGVTKVIKHDEGTWHKPTTLKDLYNVLQSTMKTKTRLIVGNTGMGVFKYDGPYEHFIDVKVIPELYEITSTDDKIVLGANITLTQMIEVFKKKTETSDKSAQSSIWNYFAAPQKENEGWEYCEALAHHISYIANVPVRNAASWAGNLQMKHDHHDFPSDVFAILEAAGAKVTVDLLIVVLNIPKRIFKFSDVIIIRAGCANDHMMELQKKTYYRPILLTWI